MALSVHSRVVNRTSLVHLRYSLTSNDLCREGKCEHCRCDGESSKNVAQLSPSMDALFYPWPIRYGHYSDAQALTYLTRYRPCHFIPWATRRRLRHGNVSLCPPSCSATASSQTGSCCLGLDRSADSPPILRSICHPSLIRELDIEPSVRR
jgi:hypothetical protein